MLKKQKSTVQIIAIGDLKGVRNKSNKGRKTERSKSHKLKEYIKYKALEYCGGRNFRIHQSMLLLWLNEHRKT